MTGPGGHFFGSVWRYSETLSTASNGKQKTKKKTAYGLQGSSQLKNGISSACSRGKHVTCYSLSCLCNCGHRSSNRR